MTIKRLKDLITNELQPLYDKNEAAAIANLYLENLLSMSPFYLTLNAGSEVQVADLQKAESDLEKLKKAVPVQYIVGEKEFFGLQFKVSPAVLIPRGETEELVSLILAYLRTRSTEKLKIWDIGTGSGCIAITLAQNLPDAEVFATDISADALEIAKYNAEKNSVNITFAQHDMSDGENLPFGNTKFDVIVSNPPYIPDYMKAQMHQNVLENEPEIALFVPDNDKFRCYKSLAVLALKSLSRDGALFVETLHNCHNELSNVFSEAGFSHFKSIKDYNDRERFMAVSVLPFDGNF